MSKRTWISRGAWAVLDQGLFAGANLLVNVLLAHWLGAAEYGAFTVAYALFLLGSMAHTALLTEPMLVFAGGRYHERQQSYLKTLAVGHWLFGVGFAGVMALVAVALGWLGATSLVWPVAAMAVAGPLMLALWLARRMCYAVNRPQWAAGVGACNLLLMLAGLGLLSNSGAFTSATAVLLLGAVGLISAMLLLGGLGVFGVPRAEGLGREAWRNHWGYGRWALAANVLVWIPGQGIYPLLSSMHGLAATGELKAMALLALPAMHAITALSTLLLPSLTRAAAEGRLDRTARAAGLILGAGALGYYLMLSLLGRPIVTLVYGSNYQDAVDMLWVVGLLPLATVLNGVLGAVLRATERPDLVFRAHLPALGVGATLGLALVFSHGAIGAAGAMVLTQLTAGAVLAALVWRGRQERAATGPVTPG